MGMTDHIGHSIYCNSEGTSALRSRTAADIPWKMNLFWEPAFCRLSPLLTELPKRSHPVRLRLHLQVSIAVAKLAW